MPIMSTQSRPDGVQALATSRNGGAAPKILIVEDEVLVALQLEDVIERQGYKVIAIVPDRASLDCIDDPPDVALVDLNLRDGLTGPEIAHALAGRYGCKVVYVTANPGDIVDPAKTAIGIVQKPFSSDAIRDAVNFALTEDETAQRPPGLDPLVH